MGGGGGAGDTISVRSGGAGANGRVIIRAFGYPPPTP
jgi:hypothetical protein